MKPDFQERPTFAHEAMTTTFHVTIAHSDVAYARQAAGAAFAELDRIERLLSRYREGSDVFRINRLAAGQSTRVHLDTFECLGIALDVWKATGGAFDIAYGSAGLRTGGPRFELDAREHTVRVLTEGVRLDLGGMGKGFALDRMAEVLTEWDLGSALLCASTSTILALAAPSGEPGWQVTFGPDHDLRRVGLTHSAFSASGKSVQGDHIIDPRTGSRATQWHRCWSAAPTAVLADALSTAFMILSERDSRDYCRRHPGVSAWALRDAHGNLITLADRLGSTNHQDNRARL